LHPSATRLYYQSMTKFGLLVLLAFPTFFGSVQGAEPADPRLNARGRAILDYFHQLQAAPETRLVSGQFCNFGPGARLEAPEKIFKVTGRWPALIAIDYTDFGQKWLDTHTTNRLLLDYWRAGGLVSAGVHLNNPAKADGGGLRDKGLDLADVLVEGTAVHQRWMRQLDDLAAGLRELQQAGVVVLWRPFHEMNGDWFWWGAQKPGALIKVWRQMFDYFTQTKGLHNLIWVYSPNKGAHTSDYYPGDAYADLVGLDVYADDIDPVHIAGYPEMIKIQKPFGFTEYGPHGASNPPGDYDFRRFLAGVVKNFPRARFFLSWDAKWNPAENKFAREFYTDPRVITRADLPPGLAGEVAADSIEAWRAERLAALTSPDSWLSLIGRHRLQPGVNSIGTAEDNTIKLAAGPAYLGTVTLADGKAGFVPAPGAIVTVDGQPATATELIYHADKPTHVEFGTANFYVMERGDGLYLRVKDRASTRLKNFPGLDYFPVDPAWQIEAQWIPFDPPHQVNITNVLGQTSPAPVPGKAVFTHDGHTIELLPIDEGSDELFFVLTDLTAGEETYEASRFLYAAKPKDGKVILDFNRMQNPPCAFTPFATCPLPPKENHLPFRVTAGEKKFRGEH
jgi:uncharacterized protein (DUF1684 family)